MQILASWEQNDPVGHDEALADAIQEFLYTEPEDLQQTPAVRVVPNVAKSSTNDIIRFRADLRSRIQVPDLQVPTAVPPVPNTSELGTTIETYQLQPTLSQQHDSQETITAKTVASNSPKIIDASDTYVLEIQPYVVSPQQLPSTIVQVLNKTGKTRTSAMLTCRMQNGLLCTVPMRQLATIIGDTALQQLMSAFESAQS
jgi:hypothetical protein